MTSLHVALLGAAVAVLGSGIGVPRTADEPRVNLPADIAFHSADDSPDVVVFRHWTHVALERARCDGCHPGLFSILDPQRLARHEEMDAGRSCGACHDGRRAFATSDTDACLSCHGDDSPLSPLPEAPDGRLLGASRLPQGDDSPGPVRFDHAVHLGGAEGCSTCHPQLAPMQAGVSAASKDELLAGRSCGACHDGQRAFGVDDDRCERCHDIEEAP